MKRHLPNLISVARLLLAAPVFFAIRAGENETALLLLAACLATDGADGFLARKWNAISDLGRMLDPLADKTVAGMVALSLFLWRELPLWFLLAVVIRDALILLGGEWMRRRSGTVPSANMIGKITINVIVAVLLSWLFDVNRFKQVGLYVGAFFLVASFIAYARGWRDVWKVKSLDRNGVVLPNSKPQR